MLPLFAGTVPSRTVIELPDFTPVYGAMLQFTAAVTGTSGSSSRFPSGTIVFTIDGQSTSPFYLNSNGLASISLWFNAGNHTIGAAYSGDADYAPSTATTATVLVNKAATALALASDPAQIGQPVTLLAVISILSPGNGPLAGTVRFTRAGVTDIAGCTAVPVVNGVASCSTSPQATFMLTAYYSGDANTGTTTNSMLVTVNKLAPSIYLAAAPDTPVYGAAVYVNALLLGADGSATPSGTVTFSDGGAVVGTQALGKDGRASQVGPLKVGVHSFTATYNGDTLYQTVTTPSPLTVTVAKAASKTVVSSDPAQLGQSFLMRASVTLSGTAAPASGTVDFSIGTTVVPGCTQLKLQAGAANCGTTLPQLGAFTLTANYSGDANTAPSSDSVSISVGKVIPGIYLASSPAQPVYGTPVTLSVLLLAAPGMPTPTGAVTFSDGTLQLGAAAAGSDGRATLLMPLAVGVHNIGASYGGDSRYQNAMAPGLPVTVGKAATNTSLTVAPGGPFVATVSVVSPGAGVPTGAVQFTSGGAIFAMAPVSAQGSVYSAVLPTSNQSGAILATYVGDSNFAGSTSAAATVTAPAVAVSLSSDRNPARPDQTVSFTATVSVPGKTLGADPTGTISFFVDGAPFVSPTLRFGQAAFSTTLTTGSHIVSARYNGDALYAPAIATMTELVTAAAESLTVTSNASSTVFGQPVILTAHLGGAHSGAIQFSEGTAALGSAPLAAGTAELTLFTLPAGTHTITAAWSGDTVSATASADIVQTVRKAGTSTALITSAGVLRASVSALSPGVGTPTGSVRFVNPVTNAVLANPSLQGGAASVPAPANSDPVVATYDGDGNFAGSVSSAIAPLSAANAASYGALAVAPDEIVSLFGANLAAGTYSATGQPAAILGGVSVKIVDSAGATQAAPLLFASPSQVAITLPAGLALGAGTLRLVQSTGGTLSTPVTVARVAPGIFTADSSGHGVPAGQTMRVDAAGAAGPTQPVAAYDAQSNAWRPVAIDLGNPSERVYLTLYGTGIRHFARFPQCTIAGQPATVVYAGAQSAFAGLDQINILVPAELKGSGLVNLVLTVDGVDSNAVTLAFQ